MKEILNLYLFASVLTTIFICSYVFSRTKTAYMKFFFALSLAVAVYSLGYLMEINSNSLAEAVFWNQIQYAAVPFTSVLWFCTIVLYVRRRETIAQRHLFLLFSIPVLSFLARLTNGLHHMFYPSWQWWQTAGISILWLEKGPFYYVQSAYHIILLAATAGQLYHAYKNQPHEAMKARAGYLVSASVVAFVGLVLTIVNYGGWGLDYAILLMPGSIVLITMAITKYDFLEVSTLSQRRLFEVSDDALLLLHLDDWLVDFNRSAEKFFQQYGITLQPGPLTALLQAEPLLKQRLLAEQPQIVAGKHGKVWKTATVILTNKQGIECARIKSIADITEQVQREQKLEHFATTDGTSQVHNFGHFMKRAEQEFEQAQRYQLSFCVILLDIDHFKTVNDTYGHLAGNAVIRHTGTLLKQRFHASDIVGRLGGDEFAVLVVSTALPQAKAAAEDFRRTIASQAMTYKDQSFFVTVSVGVSAFEPTDNTFEDTLHRADEALYYSKDAGRNCTTALTP